MVVFHRLARQNLDVFTRTNQLDNAVLLCRLDYSNLRWVVWERLLVRSICRLLGLEVYSRKRLLHSLASGSLNILLI